MAVSGMSMRKISRFAFLSYSATANNAFHCFFFEKNTLREFYIKMSKKNAPEVRRGKTTRGSFGQGVKRLC